MNDRLNEKKLKRLFFLCLIVVILLIVVTSIDFDEIQQNDNQEIENGNVNVSSYQKFESLNYNNLSSAEKDYISSMYFGNVRFTENGVEVYNEGDRLGTLDMIITSEWPTNEMGNFIPVADYGDLNRIEYAEDWIAVYIDDAKKSNVNDYMKLLKKYNFTENEEKDEGKVMLQYKIYNENGDSVIVRYMKEAETLLIMAEKVK